MNTRPSAQNADLAMKLRRLADRIERMPDDVAHKMFVSGGEALFTHGPSLEPHVAVVNPAGFALTNYALFIGDTRFVDRATTTYQP